MLRTNQRCIGEQCVRAFATHFPTHKGRMMDINQQIPTGTSSEVFRAACSRLSLLLLVRCSRQRGREERQFLND